MKKAQTHVEFVPRLCDRCGQHQQLRIAYGGLQRLFQRLPCTIQVGIVTAAPESSNLIAYTVCRLCRDGSEMIMPVHSKRNDSVRTSLRIHQGFIPRAFSRPNSRMRSNTAISVVLTSPNPIATNTTRYQIHINPSSIFRYAV